MATASRKRCTNCGKTKAASSFSRSAKKSGGLQDWCKSCLKDSKTAPKKGQPGRPPSAAKGAPAMKLTDDQLRLIHEQLVEEGIDKRDAKARQQLLAMHAAAVAKEPPPDPEAESQERSALWILLLREMFELDPVGFIAKGCELLEQIGELSPAEAARRLDIELPALG